MATQIYLGNPPENIKKWIKENYKPAFKLTDPLCFTAEEANATLYLNNNQYGEYDKQIVYSYDKTNWNTYEGGAEITLANIGDKVYFRAADGIDNMTLFGCSFYITGGKIAASGNINTLLKADGSILDLTGRANCYSDMFSHCTSLTQAPELPATTLADYCYETVFEGCKSLTKAPKLPATILDQYCCYCMFNQCKSPFTFTDKTFDEIAKLTQEQEFIGDWTWYDENDEPIDPVEIICSDKTMLATFDENEYTWILTEK